jgi:hypothetical protein
MNEAKTSDSIELNVSEKRTTKKREENEEEAFRKNECDIRLAQKHKTKVMER